MTGNYWLSVFTVETWKEFQQHGGDVAGFTEKRWTSVQKIQPGDFLLCYAMRISKFVGLLEVAGEPFFDRQKIWSSGVYPSRVPVRTILALEPEQGVPVLEMRERLTILRNLADPKWWSGYFQTSPSRWNSYDGETVINALKDAKEKFSGQSLPCKSATRSRAQEAARNAPVTAGAIVGCPYSTWASILPTGQRHPIDGAASR